VGPAAARMEESWMLPWVCVLPSSKSMHCGIQRSAHSPHKPSSRSRTPRAAVLVHARARSVGRSKKHKKARVSSKGSAGKGNPL
jgi:hypothetical protein